MIFDQCDYSTPTLQNYRAVKFFADDLKMYAEIKAGIDADIFQCALDKLAAWADEWQLQISVSKCSVMHIGPPSVERDYYLNGLLLPHTTSIRDLGVVVNEELTPCSHIASITVTANQRCNLIFRCFVSRDVNLLVRVFTTYTSSQFWNTIQLSGRLTLREILSVSRKSREDLGLPNDSRD